MVLLIRRISQRWVGKYDLFNFIGETQADFPVSGFDDERSLLLYLQEYYLNKTDELSLIQSHVYPDESDIWLYIVDTVSKEAYPVRVNFNLNVELKPVK